MNKLSLTSLTGRSDRSGNRCDDGDWYNSNGCGSVKTTKSLGFVGRDSGCDDGKDGEGNEYELGHFE